LYELGASFAYSVLVGLLRAHGGIADEFLACAIGMCTAVIAYQFHWAIGNPVVLWLGVLYRNVHWLGAILATAAQAVGMLLGALMVWAIYPTAQLDNAIAMPMNLNYSLWTLVAIETVASVTFAVAYMVSERVAETTSSVIVIGLAMTVSYLIAYPLLHTGVNMWYHLAYALIVNEWDRWWVYYVGPVCAFVISAIVSLFTRSRDYSTNNSWWDAFTMESCD
jgi:glycerol uptake facilitator-like aquaporin